MNDKRTEHEVVHLEPTLAGDLRRLSHEGSEPQHDLWPEIRNEIERVGTGSGSAWWLRLAAALLVVSGLVAIAWLLSRQSDTDWQALEVRARSQADLPGESNAELRAIFVRHLEEREELLRLVAQALETYPPELRRDIRENIAVIEDAMQELEGSLVELPGAPAEQLQLASLYDRELRLLRDLNARLRGYVADQE